MFLLKSKCSVSRGQETVPSLFFSYVHKLRAKKPMALQGGAGHAELFTLLHYLHFQIVPGINCC